MPHDAALPNLRGYLTVYLVAAGWTQGGLIDHFTNHDFGCACVPLGVAARKQLAHEDLTLLGRRTLARPDEEG